MGSEKSKIMEHRQIFVKYVLVEDTKLILSSLKMRDSKVGRYWSYRIFIIRYNMVFERTKLMEHPQGFGTYVLVEYIKLILSSLKVRDNRLLNISYSHNIFWFLKELN